MTPKISDSILSINRFFLKILILGISDVNKIQIFEIENAWGSTFFIHFAWIKDLSRIVKTKISRSCNNAKFNKTVNPRGLLLSEVG